MAVNPNEPRDKFGRWTSFGGALSGGDGRRRPRPLRPQDWRVRRETRPFRAFGIKGEVRYLGEQGPASPDTPMGTIEDSKNHDLKVRAKNERSEPKPWEKLATQPIPNMQKNPSTS